MTAELDDLFAFLRFASISTDSRHASAVSDCADWLRQQLEQMGLSAQRHNTAGHPVIVARNAHQPGRKTVLIYGHYDVQPVDPLSLWHSDPFTPELRDGRIWARGATDNKGQMLAHVLGVRATLREHGDLPVNLIFLFEGEEEIGSPHLAPFLHAHAAELACDVVAISDTGMVAPGVPTLGYGLRGIACAEILIHGPSGDLHSGIFGGAVANPAMALARLLATFHDDHGHIAIPGFYDDVLPLADWERQMWQSVPGVSDADFVRLTGAPKTASESGYRAVEAVWARPTAEINGLASGYQGEGSKTVLPASAMAKLSFRLVPAQDPERILTLVQQHVAQHVSDQVRCELILGHHGKPYATDPHSPAGLAAQRALRAAFAAEPVLIREGGSIPIVQQFRDILGADTLLLGLALPDAQVHAPNENFPVANFEAGIRLNQHLLRELAQW